MATYASIKYDMDLSSNATGAGPMTLLSTQTASSSSTLSFTSGIDSTYDEYIFKFYDIHPATNNVDFQVNFRDGSSAYDATKTSSVFYTYADEADTTGDVAVSYLASADLAQSTGVQQIALDVGSDNDESLCGTLQLFAPSSTTFVKHFIGNISFSQSDDVQRIDYVAGYFNTTSAVDALQFKFSSGNIDAGTITLYGIS